MEQQQVNESSNMEQFEPDPLLQPGAFIDPNPNPNPEPHPPTTPPNGVADNKTNGKSPPSSSTIDPTPASVKTSKPCDETPLSARPVWLPPDWNFVERVRATGASAGSRDKYYVCPVTKRRFRSKREVFYYLETGSTKKRKNADSDVADSTPATDSPAKGKKSEAKAKKSEAKAKKMSPKKFNFDDVPAKVKWMLTDIYDLKWRPLVNGVDRVPESAKQEWSAAFTYLTLQNGGGNAFL